jgi:hypothetical protein
MSGLAIQLNISVKKMSSSEGQEKKFINTGQRWEKSRKHFYSSSEYRQEF